MTGRGLGLMVRATAPIQGTNTLFAAMSTTTDDAPPAVAPARGLMAVVDWASGSHARAAALLVAFALVAFVPGFFQIPPVDRDEARFAQATKQMLETGDYVDIRFQNEVRYKKPVGIYWLQAAAVKAARSARHPAGAHHHLALPHAVAARRDRRGAADLLGRARLRVAPHLAAGGADDGELDPARRRGAARQDRRMLLFTCVAAMGAMARIYLAQRHEAPGRQAGASRRSSGPRWRRACCSRAR